MIIHGKLKGYKIISENTHIEVVVENAHLRKLYKYTGGGKSSLEIHLEDGRSITGAQRKLIFATIRDASEHLGYEDEELRKILVMLHSVKNNIKYFSLKDCSIDIAKSFINTILEFCLMMEVPLTAMALERTDDIATWMMLAYSYKVCAICGKHGEAHHIDAIGMGRNRNKVYKEQLDGESKMIELCRVHHTEAETIGKDSFCRKYHVIGIKKKFMEGETK